MIHNVLDYGPKGVDDTALIQKAVDAAKPGDTVVVPPGVFRIDGLRNTDHYVSGGVFLKSDMIFVIQGTLQAITNTSDHYTILTAHNCKNLEISGGGTIIGDRDTHPQDPGAGQWGYGISLWSSENVKIRDLRIARLWGDGIIILDGKNIAVDFVTIDGCVRQNMSLSAVDGLKITNTTFQNCGMTNLDLEPELAVTQVIQNVVVKNCNFVKCGTLFPIGSKKVHIGLGSEAGYGTFKNISISDCQFDDRMQPIWAHGTAGTTGIPAWAYSLNVIFYQGLKAPWYRFWGYPTSWSKT